MGKKVNKALGKFGRIFDPVGYNTEKFVNPKLGLGDPYDPLNFAKSADKILNPQAPKPTTAEQAAAQRQATDLANTDSALNTVRKRSLLGRYGARAFRTSALDRQSNIFGAQKTTPSATYGRTPAADRTSPFAGGMSIPRMPSLLQGK